MLVLLRCVLCFDRMGEEIVVHVSFIVRPGREDSAGAGSRTGGTIRGVTFRCRRIGAKRLVMTTLQANGGRTIHRSHAATHNGRG